MTLDLSLLPDGGVRWLDASGAHSDVVLSTRVRLARNVDGYAFTGRARDGERLRVLVAGARSAAVLPGLDDSFLVRIDELGPGDRALLFERHLVSKELAGLEPQHPLRTRSGRVSVGRIERHDQRGGSSAPPVAAVRVRASRRVRGARSS